MKLYAVIEHVPFEGARLFGLFPSFEEARTFFEGKKAEAIEADKTYTADTEWLYGTPDIEGWEAGSLVESWSATGTPLWRNEQTGEER